MASRGYRFEYFQLDPADRQLRRDAVARHQDEALILHAPASTARYRWFVHTIVQ